MYSAPAVVSLVDGAAVDIISGAGVVVVDGSIMSDELGTAMPALAQLDFAHVSAAAHAISYRLGGL